MTTTDFLKWMEFLEWEINSFHREDHYWAQIALEIKRAFHTNSQNLTMDEFLLKFERRAPVILTEEDREKIQERQAQESEAYWMSICGYQKSEDKVDE